ncbi:hypothetical protein GC163_18045 [bacterium]|nr:hypothetical protein [bacterium]
MTPRFRFQELMQRYSDGVATSLEVEELCGELRNSEAARHEFITLLNLESALESVAAEWAAAHPQPIVISRRRLLPALPRKGFLVTLGLCLAIMLGYQWWTVQSNRVFATVENGTGVRELPGGTELRSEWIEIAGGTVELLTATSARVVIEAPATFRFDSPMRLNLVRGRLAADIPPSARKFTVVTPSGEAVDLGTKFGVDVPQRAEAEIHVFQGEVIAQASNGGQRKNLHSGEAFRLKSGAGSTRNLRSAAFIRPEEVRPLHAALSAGQPLKAETELGRLREDPSFVAILDFESPELPEGMFDSVQGRWPGSRAAEFNQATDYLRITLPQVGRWTQLTMAAWVRLNQLEDTPHSLLLATNAKGEIKHSLQWTIDREGVPQLLLSGTPVRSKAVATRETPESEQDRWIHLAAVYDAEHGRASLFVNGVLVNQGAFAKTHQLAIQRLVIGSPRTGVQRLSGRMDEFVLLGRALSHDEIRTMFETGNPYL